MINPYESDQTPLEADDRRLCGCGDARCWLVEDDPTNVIVRGQVYAADCVGLCMTCGEVDDLRNLLKAGGGRLVHDGCPDAAMAAGREREARMDLREGK